MARTATAQSVMPRQLGSVPFTASSKYQQKVERGGVWRRWGFRLRYAPTLTAANNTTANTLRGDELAIINSVSLIANGNDVLYKATAEELFQDMRIEQWRLPQIQSTLGDGSTANPAVDTTVVVNFASPKLFKPIDTCLDTRKYADLRWEWDFNTFTGPNASATAFTTNPTIDTFVEEAYNVPLDAPFSTKRVNTQIYQPAGANSNYRMELAVGDIHYRYLLINTQDGSNVDSGAIVNSWRIESAGTRFYDLTNTDSRRLAEYRYELGDFTRRSAKTLQAGWTLIDLCPDARLTEALDAMGLGDLWLVADVASAGTIRVRPQSIANQ